MNKQELENYLKSKNFQEDLKKVQQKYVIRKGAPFPYWGNDTILINKSGVGDRYIVDKINPTGNCQLRVWAYMDSLLGVGDFNRVSYNGNRIDYFNLLLIFLMIIFRKTNKKIIVADIRENHLKKLKTLFKPLSNKIHIKRYTSTNLSKMVLVRIEIKGSIRRDLYNYAYRHKVNEGFKTYTYKAQLVENN